MAMLPTRFLEPWGVSGADAQDMRCTSASSSTHLLVVADKTSKCPLFAFPIAAKELIEMACHLLDLCLASASQYRSERAHDESSPQKK